ncbi:MAG: rhodanese-like domain-containing protein [Chloroflexota bacterium]
MSEAIDRLDLDPVYPVAVCLSGHRSLPCPRLLRGHGFEAYSLKGGILAWKKAGFLPTTSRRGTRRATPTIAATLCVHTRRERLLPTVMGTVQLG